MGRPQSRCSRGLHPQYTIHGATFKGDPSDSIASVLACPGTMISSSPCAKEHLPPRGQDIELVQFMLTVRETTCRSAATGPIGKMVTQFRLRETRPWWWARLLKSRLQLRRLGL